MTIGELGIAMNKEAQNVKGDSVTVSKNCWLVLAELLINTEEQISALEETIKKASKSLNNSFEVFCCEHCVHGIYDPGCEEEYKWACGCSGILSAEECKKQYELYDHFSK